MKVFSSCLLSVVLAVAFVLLVSIFSASSSLAQQTAASSSAPTTASWCSQTTGVSTYFGAASSGSLITSDVSSKCALPQYQLVSGQTYRGIFSSNLKGDYTYTAPTSVEGTDVIFVDVFCYNNQGVSVALCRQTFVAQIAAPFTLAPTTPSPSTPAPTDKVIDTCPVVYHFTATTGTVLSASLRTAVGQPSCPYGTWFEIGRQPNFGSINLVANGDFSYSAPSSQTWDDFSYTLYCFNDVLCKGTAYVLVSGTALPTTAAPSGGPTPSGPAGGFTNKPSFTCSGACIDKSWKSTPDSPPYKWDTADQNAIRTSDGVRVGTVRANYDNGSIVITIFGKLGNLGQRFPTFEPIPFHSGETFSAQNILSRVSATSLGFSADCLGRQPAGGMGEEVWHWKSLINRTGELGPYHATGSSWYQKFGGGHNQCDTFVDSCTYAPLITPNVAQDVTTGGVWSVAITDCDITWTGRFSLNALLNMKTKSGASVWSVTDGRTVTTTLYLQAVQPTSWLQPIMGYETDLISKPLVLTLDPDVRVTLDSAATKLFSIDAAFYNRKDSVTGDYSFDLNLRLYPHVPSTASSSYQADRHVSGFRWIDQYWNSPSSNGCPTCTGTDTECHSNSRAPSNTFFSADQVSSCTNPAVIITKGPAMSTASCINNIMYIYDRPGLSTPRDCASTFQNLTIRGRAPGSFATTSFFGFDGTINVQFILDTGITVTASIKISRFVSTISADGSGITGRTGMCRASEYWPVLDPFGTSSPIAPYFLSSAATDALTNGNYLCTAQSRYVGSTSWATVMLDVTGYNNVLVESMYIEFNDARFDEAVYFISRDPVTGAASKKLPDGKKNVWWNQKYPFFNFRDLSTLLDSFNHSTEAIRVADFQRAPAWDSPQVDFAIAFTPGAIGITTSATLTFSVRIRNPDGSLGGHVTLRTLMYLDGLLADRDVAGIHQNSGDTVVTIGGADTTYIAVAVSGGLIAGVIAVLVIFVAVDTSKPLPTWIPKAHELAEVVMSPLALNRSSDDAAVAAAAKKAASIQQRVDGIDIPSIAV